MAFLGDPSCCNLSPLWELGTGSQRLTHKVLVKLWLCASYSALHKYWNIYRVSVTGDGRQQQ